MTQVASVKGVVEHNSLEGLRCWDVTGESFQLPLRYQPEEYLGAGAYGVVIAAKDHDTDRSVAIKKCKSVLKSKTLAKRVLREIRLLRVLNHENICSMHDVMIPSKTSHSFRSLYIVLELMGTDLASVIRSDQELSDKHCRYFVVQLCRAVAYMHGSCIIHRDLKPRNILVNENCTLKVADFGLARVTCTASASGVVHMTEYVTTRWYRAPEILLTTGSYDESIDMWAVGCVLAELLGRAPIFPGTDSATQVKLICETLGMPRRAYLRTISGHAQELLRKHCGHTKRKVWGSLYPDANPKALALINQLLRFDSEERITAEDALRADYFSCFSRPDPICYLPEPYLTEEFAFEVAQGLSLTELREEIVVESQRHRPQSQRVEDKDEAPTTSADTRDTTMTAMTVSEDSPRAETGTLPDHPPQTPPESQHDQVPAKEEEKELVATVVSEEMPVQEPVPTQMPIELIEQAPQPEQEEHDGGKKKEGGASPPSSTHHSAAATHGSISTAQKDSEASLTEGLQTTAAEDEEKVSEGRDIVIVATTSQPVLSFEHIASTCAPCIVNDEEYSGSFEPLVPPESSTSGVATKGRGREAKRRDKGESTPCAVA